MQRFWWVIGVVLVWLAVFIPQPAWMGVHTSPADEPSIRRDWLVYGGVSGYEQADATGFRWLIVQPKESYTQLNRHIEQSLARASVLMAQYVGAPSWYVVHLTLFSTTPKSVTIHGVARTLTWDLLPQVRTYRVLMPYTIVPTQSHMVSLVNPQYDAFGITSTRVEQDSRDMRQKIARWYGSIYQPIVTPFAHRIWYILVLCVPMAWAYWVSRRIPGTHPVLVWASALGVIAAGWVWESWTGHAWSLAPLIAAGITLLVWYVLHWVNPVLHQRWPRASIIVLYALAVGMHGMHAYAVASWMQGLDFATVPTWRDFVAYVAQMRMAMPIPLLTIEYLLYRSGVPGLLTVVYLTFVCRAVLLAGVVWALFEGVRTRTQALIACSIAGVVVAGIAFVSRYYDRNVWMVYDAWFAGSMLVLWHLLRRVPAMRWGWLGAGILIVWLDAMRPFMLVFTPLLAVVMAWRFQRRAGWQAVWWSMAPLTLSVAWHIYHGVVLGQWSWSSHSGFNIARAWYPILAAQVLATPLPDMNSPAYMAVSADVMRQTVVWMLTHPYETLVRAGQLCVTMLSIPVEMMRLADNGTYVVLTRSIPWYVWAYRAVLGIGLFGHLLYLIQAVRMRRFVLDRTLNAGFVWAVIAVMSASEYGEQARFFVSMVPLIVYMLPVTLARIRRGMRTRIRRHDRHGSSSQHLYVHKD